MSGTNGSWKWVEKLTLRAPGDFRSSGGCRQPEGMRETRVTRPVTEFPDRPRASPPRQSHPSFRGRAPRSHSRQVEREIMHWSRPSSQERRSATDWLSFVDGVLSIDGDHRVRESPAGDAGIGNCGFGAKRAPVLEKLAKFDTSLITARRASL